MDWLEGYSLEILIRSAYHDQDSLYSQESICLLLLASVLNFRTHGPVQAEI